MFFFSQSDVVMYTELQMYNLNCVDSVEMEESAHFDLLTYLISSASATEICFSGSLAMHYGSTLNINAVEASNQQCCQSGLFLL